MAEESIKLLEQKSPSYRVMIDQLEKKHQHQQTAMDQVMSAGGKTPLFGLLGFMSDKDLTNFSATSKAKNQVVAEEKNNREKNGRKKYKVTFGGQEIDGELFQQLKSHGIIYTRKAGFDEGIYFGVDRLEWRKSDKDMESFLKVFPRFALKIKQDEFIWMEFQQHYPKLAHKYSNKKPLIEKLIGGVLGGIIALVTASITALFAIFYLPLKPILWIAWNAMMGVEHFWEYKTFPKIDVVLFGIPLFIAAVFYGIKTGYSGGWCALGDVYKSTIAGIWEGFFWKSPPPIPTAEYVLNNPGSFSARPPSGESYWGPFSAINRLKSFESIHDIAANHEREQAILQRVTAPTFVVGQQERTKTQQQVQEVVHREDSIQSGAPDVQPVGLDF